MEVQLRCELEVGLLFLLWPGVELGWEGSRRVGRPGLCIAASVGLYALPAATVVWCPCVSLSTLGHCCRLLEAVWKSAGSVVRLSRATLSAWRLSQASSGSGVPPLAAVTAVSQRELIPS